MDRMTSERDEVQEIPLLTWGLLRQVFTVETIMTPRRDLLTGEQGTDLASAWAEARRRKFDLLPITQDGRIVEVLLVEGGEREPLTDRWLVSRDTAIPDLLQILLESGRPGFFVFIYCLSPITSPRISAPPPRGSA